MANITLLGSSSTPLSLASSDNLYVSVNGSLLVTSGTAPAIGTTSTSVSAIDAVIDGRIVNMNVASAIQFHRALETDSGSNTVTIGANGFISSATGFFEGAIDMVGTSNTVINFGMIISDGSGIQIDGANALARNTGTISATATGISLRGDDARIINSGHVQGINGLSVSGADTRVENTGFVEASNFGGGSGIGGVNFSAVTQSQFINAGHVSSVTGNGLNISAASLGKMFVENSGTISAANSGVELAGSTATLTLLNSGVISGNDDGVYAFTGDVHILNAATGRISSTGGDALDIREELDLVNYGEVTASGPTGRAIVLGANAGFSSITNHGQIATTFGSAIDASALLVGGALFVTNHGSIEGNYTGSGAVDVVRNFGTMSAMFTGNGNDSLRNGGLISSVVLLGAGSDTYRGHLGRVESYVDAGQDNDTVIGGAFEDDFRGGTGDDLIEGRDGNDSLAGSSGADTLKGGSGDDEIAGGTEQDLMTGGAGGDVFVFTSALDISNGALRDRITDFGTGADKIDLSAFMAGANFIGGSGFSGSALQIRYNAPNGQLMGDVNGDGVADWTLVLGGASVFTAAMLVL